MSIYIISAFWEAIKLLLSWHPVNSEHIVSTMFEEEGPRVDDVSTPQRQTQFLPLSAGQIWVRLIPILCLFSNQLFI
jgi:hypothetical protein